MEAVLAGYEPTEHDVFAAVFPKSGNNWMMQVATQITYRGNAEFEHIHDLVAWPQAPVRELIVPLATPTHERSPTGLRVIKSQLPHPLTPYNELAHYLTVIRDPCDTMVSTYHFINGVLGGIVDAQFTLDQLFDFTLAERMPICWAEHAASWWALRERDNVMVATFREMKQDLDGVVRRAATAMGVTLSEPEVAAVVARSEFAYMKAHESQFSPPVPNFRGEAAAMIRAGKVGEGKRALTGKQRAALDAHYRRKLAALGSALPYDALFNSD